MNRAIKIGLAVVMVVSVIGLGVIGCQPAEPEVYNLKFVHTFPEGSWYDLLLEERFVEQIEEQSGGRIEIVTYPGETLVKVEINVDALMEGVCDLLWVAEPQHVDKFPLTSVWALPMLGSGSVKLTNWRREIEQEHGFHQAEYEKLGLRLIGGGWVGEANAIFIKAKPANRVEDLKGISTRVSSPIYADYLARLEMVPIRVPFHETYDALVKGMVDAACTDIAATDMIMWPETGDPGYLIDLGLPSLGASALAMNKAVYDSLPKDLQQVIDDVTWAYMGEHAAKCYESVGTAIKHMEEEWGTTIIVWDDAEKQRTVELLTPRRVEWAAEMDGKGLPGSEIMAAIEAMEAAM